MACGSGIRFCVADSIGLACQLTARVVVTHLCIWLAEKDLDEILVKALYPMIPARLKETTILACRKRMLSPAVAAKKSWTDLPAPLQIGFENAAGANTATGCGDHEGSCLGLRDVVRLYASRR